MGRGRPKGVGLTPAQNSCWAEVNPKVFSISFFFGLCQTRPGHFGLGWNWFGLENSRENSQLLTWTVKTELIHFSLLFCRTMEMAKQKKMKKRGEGRGKADLAVACGGGWEERWWWCCGFRQRWKKRWLLLLCNGSVFSVSSSFFPPHFLCFCFCPCSSVASAFIPCCFVLFFSFPLYFPSFFLSNFYIYFALYFSFSLLSFSICFLFSSSLIL